MRIIICFGVISLLLLASFLPDAKADVDIGVSIGDEGVKGLLLCNKSFVARVFPA